MKDVARTFFRLLPFFILWAGFGYYVGTKEGFKSAGGIIQAHLQSEIATQEDYSQYIPEDVSLVDAFRTNAYSHCISYPGVGVVFSGTNQQKELVVKSVLGGYPVDKLKEKGIVLQKGDLVLTPLEVIQGDLNSPLKIEYRLHDDPKKKTKEILVTRKLIQKCFLKEKRNQEDGNEIAH